MLHHFLIVIVIFIVIMQHSLTHSQASTNGLDE